MPVEATIEKRLAAVEEAVLDLRRRLEPGSNWLSEVIGSQAGEPAFDEVLELGRAFRESDRPGVEP